MASLKEIKGRILSVENTRKITSARQMISSAYLHRAQNQLEQIRRYKQELDRLVSEFLLPGQSPETVVPAGTSFPETAVVIFSSNSGMCGSFNMNMIKQIPVIVQEYACESLIWYPVGSKIRDALRKLDDPVDSYGIGDLDSLAGKWSWQEVHQVVDHLIRLYQSEKVKQIILVYYYYQTVSRYEIRIQPLLPYPFRLDRETCPDHYLIEPGTGEMAGELIRLSVYATFYHALISNQTSEHAARLIAMQLATENADELQEELRLTYNKLRQQSITSELLDIIGNTFGG